MQNIGHRCGACKEPFFSEKARDRFCVGCRDFINRTTEVTESLLENYARERQREEQAIETFGPIRGKLRIERSRQKQKKIKEEFWGILKCPLCEYQATISLERLPPVFREEHYAMLENLGKLRGHSKELVMALLKHRAHHAFPGRFLYSRRLTPEWVRKLSLWEKRIEPFRRESKFYLDAFQVDCPSRGWLGVFAQSYVWPEVLRTLLDSGRSLYEFECVLADAPQQLLRERGSGTEGK